MGFDNRLRQHIRIENSKIMVILTVNYRFIRVNDKRRFNSMKLQILYTNKVNNVNLYITYSKFAAIGALYDKGIGDS